MALIINRLKKEIIKASYKAQEGHIPSAFSILDIIWVLYDRILKIDPKKPHDPKRDYFILSKGHGCLGLYAVLGAKGFFPKTWLKNFAQSKSCLGSHPDRNQVAGVEASTGSLGHGLPIAVGIAMGLKIKKRKNRVVCLIGDGEANEGSIWEAVMLGAQHNLDNLVCIVDDNHSTDRALKLNSLPEKFTSFGWKAMEINGHDHQQIYQALSQRSGKPLAVVAETIKGCGIKQMENNPAWHHRPPNRKEMDSMLKELS